MRLRFEERRAGSRRSEKASRAAGPKPGVGAADAAAMTEREASGIRAGAGDAGHAVGRRAVTRRDLCRAGLGLAAGLAAGTGLLSAPRARAGVIGGPRPAARSSPPRPVVLVSDMHIAADPDKRLLGAHLSRNFGRVVDRLAAGPRPGAVLMGGDASLDRGRAGDYRQLGRLLRPLLDAGLDVRTVLGNHDDRAAFGRVFPGAWAADGQRLARHVDRVRRPEADWYLLDSLRETDETPGELGASQTRWLRESLDADPDRPAFVLVHHPPGRRGSPTRSSVGLADGAELMDTLLTRPQVKALFHGHLHRYENWSHAGLHVIGLPATAYRLGFGPGRSQGYLETRTDGRTLRLTRRRLRAGQRHDGAVRELRLRKG